MSGGNKEKVVQAAMELFHRKGFQATGLEEILTCSGVCRSNFYYHFKSKDELGAAVLDEKIMEMHRDYVAPTLGSRTLPPKERLVLFFREMIGFCEAHGCRMGCMLGNLTLELADHHEGIRTRVETYFRGLEGIIVQTLREGQADGSIGLRGLSPEDTAAAAVSLLQGGILLAKGYKETGPLVSGLRLLIQYIGDGNGSNGRAAAN